MPFYQNEGWRSPPGRALLFERRPTDTGATDPAPDMQTRRLRPGLSLAALCVAVLVCLQIGLIRVREQHGSAAHGVELETLKRARATDVARLETQLERVERELTRLRREHAAAATESTQLESALEAATAVREQLNQRVRALSDTLEEQRPFLDVYLATSDSPPTLAAVAENRGEQPLSIWESHGWLWVDGERVALGGSLAPSELAPGSTAEVFEFDPRTRSLEFVPGSNAPVRGALCFVYGRMLRDDSVPWVEERWFEYRPADGIAATVASDSWPLAEDAIPCQLDDAPPPW
jgi:hypothetical protein